jgi:SAM-dependent methyltransferase
MTDEPRDSQLPAVGAGVTDGSVTREGDALTPGAAAENLTAPQIPKAPGLPSMSAVEPTTGNDAQGRKLAPPPKPVARPASETPKAASAAVQGSRMIVVGEPTPPPPRGGAQAWTRPNSEAPGPRSNPPPSPDAPGRGSQPTLDLRSRLGIPRARMDSAPGSRPQAAPLPARPASTEGARKPELSPAPPLVEPVPVPMPPPVAPVAPAASSAEREPSSLPPPSDDAVELDVDPDTIPPPPVAAAVPPVAPARSPSSQAAARVESGPAPPPAPRRDGSVPSPSSGPRSDSARHDRGAISALSAPFPPSSHPAPRAGNSSPPGAALPAAAALAAPLPTNLGVAVAEAPASATSSGRFPAAAPSGVAVAAAAVSAARESDPLGIDIVVEAPATDIVAEAPAAVEPPPAVPEALATEPTQASATASPAPEAPKAAPANSVDAPTPTPDTPGRVKSEPARLRSGPPRPKASNPAFSANRSQGSRPSAGAPPDDADALAEGELPGPPRVPRFPLGATGASRSSPPPPRRHEPPVTASAIAVMRIVAVGAPAREVAPEVDEAAVERDESEPLAEVAARAPAREDELEEIAAEEVATLVTGVDSAAIPIDVDETISIPPPDIEPQPAPSPPSPRELDGVKPPPPPQRKPKTPSLPKPAPQTKRRQKPPWWEEVFAEDFVRAGGRLTDDQIRREVDFIEESLGVASGGVVLDLGCGPGHHAVELTSRGYGVVGYDLSLYQLALASDVAHERGQKLNFLQGDMREMAFDEMFDGIFCWNTTFGYFEEEKNVLVAERVFRALRPGGMFLIDVINRDFVAASSPCQVWYEGDSCVCMDDMNLDFITSRMLIKRSVILDDGRTREVPYSIRVYSLHELGKLLHDVGFRVTEASGHPTTPGVFFGEHSPRIIMLAQKP